MNIRIVGEIVGTGKGRVRVCIHRNEPPPLGHENAFPYRANILSLKGSLSSDAIGQIWELKVRIEQTMLVIIAANPYQVNSTDLIALKGAGKRNAGNNALAQIKSGGKQPNSNTSATSTDARDLASVESESITVSSNTQAQAHQHLDQKSLAIATTDTATPKTSSSSGQEPLKNLEGQSVTTTKAKTYFERQQYHKDK